MDVPGDIAMLRGWEAPAEDEGARLWSAVQGGEDAAFEVLVTRLSARLAGVASRLLRNAADVEEVVQEAFVRAFEARHRYPRRQCVRAWLLRITINLCNSRRRTGWWRRTLLTRDYRELEAVRGPELDERATVDYALRQAVDALPESLQLPFLLRYTEELSGAEIATILGLKVSTVWSRIYAARRRLRAQLGESLDHRPEEEPGNVIAGGTGSAGLER